MRIPFSQRAIPLSAQLLMAFVGIVVATTVALTVAAYRSSLENLVAQALRDVRLAAEAHERTLHQLLSMRQRRAEGFLRSVESLCAEPAGARGFGWSEECVRTMVDQFRMTEQATGARLTFRGRTLRRSGIAVPDAVPAPDALVLTASRGDGGTDLLMRAVRGDSVLSLQFDSADLQPFFEERSALGRTGEVFLTDRQGRFLTPALFGMGRLTPVGAAVAEPLDECRFFAHERIAIDYRGVLTVHGFRPVPDIGGGCIDAHISQAEALEPAEQLRAELTERGAMFALFGAVISLLAAHRISAPVRRLARSARVIQSGNFTERIPLGGPSEVRALGRALAVMAADLAKLVTYEQSARLTAETANRSKDRFLAIVSHELRTPLNAVLGWTRLLSTGYLNEQKTRRAIDAIERNAEAQKQLVEDLLDVSRVAAGRLRMSHDSVRLAAVIDAAVDAVRPHAIEKNIRIEVGIDDDLEVSGDFQRLQQIVWNLASNAVKFTPREGLVTVTLRRAGLCAELTVADTGAGIAPEFLPHVFEWFRQQDASVERHQTGLGLGLGLVRQLVELHGGAVVAESGGTGCGARFVVTLPLRDG